MRMLRFFVVLLPAVLPATYSALGQPAVPPSTLHYQGLLTDPSGMPVANGEYDLTFRLYAGATGGTALWTEPQTVQVTRGIFHTTLGLIEPIPSTINFAQRLWLSILIEGSGELAPRFPLGAVPYAFSAATVPDSSITAPKLQAGSVGSAALKSSSVTRDKIVPGAIDSSRVGVGALSGRNLASSSILPEQIDISGAEEGQTLVVVEDQLVWTQPAPGESIVEVIAGAGLAGGGTSPIVTVEVAPAGIQTGMLADSSVTADKIAESAVETAALAPAAVGTTQLADGAVTSTKVALNAIGTTRIADGAVTAAKLSPGIEFLPDGAVTTVKLATAAVTALKIANQAVGTTKIDPAGGINGDVLGIQGNRVVWIGLRSLSEGASDGAAAKTLTEKGEEMGLTQSIEVSELRDRLSRSEMEIRALQQSMRALREELEAMRAEMGR